MTNGHFCEACSVQITDGVRNKLGLLTEDELAHALGVTPTTMATWRAAKRGPPVVKLGKSIFFLLDDVKAWVVARRIPVEIPVVSAPGHLPGCICPWCTASTMEARHD